MSPGSKSSTGSWLEFNQLRHSDRGAESLALSEYLQLGPWTRDAPRDSRIPCANPSPRELGRQTHQKPTEETGYHARRWPKDQPTRLRVPERVAGTGVPSRLRPAATARPR